MKGSMMQDGIHCIALTTTISDCFCDFINPQCYIIKNLKENFIQFYLNIYINMK